MKMTVRPIEQWPGPMTPNGERVYAPFKASWSETVDLLDREVYMLAHRSYDTLVLQMAITERDCRLDGWIRSDARPYHPGVIISFDSVHGPLRYHTDRFKSGTRQEGWQANVRAVALGLEALRKWDRYGLARDGQQYAGWRQLGSGTIELGAAMTLDAAMAYLSEQAHMDMPVRPTLFALHEWADNAFKIAAKRLHPDSGGDHDAFVRLSQARDLVLSETL